MERSRNKVVPVLGGALEITVNIAGQGGPLHYLQSAGGYYWDGFLDGLADHYKVYVPYFPGTTPGRPNDIDQIDNLWDVVVAKVIWPIPDKGLNKRIHRIIAPSLIVWGENGRLIPPVYAQTFSKAINNAEVWSRTAARTMRGIDCARAGILWRVRSGWRWASGLINSRNFRTEDLKMPRSPRIVGIPSSPFQNCFDARGLP